MEPDAECVIVGGGIGGAVLALSLGRAGRRVLILERDTAPPAMTRPEILADATMEIFDREGIGERIRREAAIPLEGFELFEAGGRRRLFTVTQAALEHAGAHPHSTDPASTRRILLDAAERTGSVQIRRGVEVEGLVREGSRVVGVSGRTAQEPVSYRAPLTIGDDGTHSRIRSAMGVPLRLQEFPFDFFGAIMPRPPDQPPRIGQAWLNLKGIRRGLFAGLFLPIPRERTALVFILTPRTAAHLRTAGPDAFYAAAKRLSPLCEAPGRLPTFPEGFGYFRRPFGLAPRYVGDGVALLGDAAHPVTPAGGQGANSSVADAAVLAGVALEALRGGDCSAARLARYEAVRRPANQRSLQFSRRPQQTFRVLQAAPWLTPLLRWFLRAVDQREPLKFRFLTSVSNAFTSSPRRS